jgi:anti-sigma regulatory factor (Ser/Thr protein kinase)
MEVTDRYVLQISDSSQVGDARRVAMALAEDLQFDETDSGRVGIAASEAANNLLKHAGGGSIRLQELRENGVGGVALVAVDKGPGIGNLNEALRDGYSSRGTSGTGLGAIMRLSTSFDIHSDAARGTVVLAQFWPGAPPAEAGLLHGGVSLAKPGETDCGDAWAVRRDDGIWTALVVDGLGHGAGAAEASQLARKMFLAEPAAPPTQILSLLHGALRPTRGAAAAIAELDRRQGLVRFAGIGNISAAIVSGGKTRSLVSHHGTLGHDVRKMQEFQYPWPEDGMLVMNSDGLISQWTISAYPGLAGRHPAIVAAVLCRDFSRGTDDATALVLREAQ